MLGELHDSDNISHLAAKPETVFALLRADVRMLAKRMDEIHLAHQRSTDRSEAVIHALEDRLRMQEQSNLLLNQRLDAAFRVLDELKAAQSTMREYVKVVNQDTMNNHNRDVLELKSDFSDHNDLQGKLEARVERVEELTPAIKAIIWVAGVLGVSVIGLLWSLITGTAQIIIK